MFYVGPAALPRPLVNRAIFATDGRLLGVADLFDPEAGLVTEFDGQEHRQRRQHRADNLREEELEAANLVVCRVDSIDLRFRAALADRLRARYAQGLRRDRSRDAGPFSNQPGGSRRRASYELTNVRSRPVWQRTAAPPRPTAAGCQTKGQGSARELRLGEDV